MNQKQDVIVRCVSCGEQYTITTSEMEWWQARNLHLPKRCRACRAERRGSTGGESEPTLRSRTEKQDNTGRRRGQREWADGR